MESYRMKITDELAEAAVLGGVFLGGGGGGSYEKGLKNAKEALKLGELYLVSLDHIKDDDIVITASAVGSPASEEQYVTPEYNKKGYKIFNELLKETIGGVITNENGGGSTINGWILSAMTGIPLIDAPCNGRAHPTALMGSMGLSLLKDYKTIQVALGGNPDKEKYIEVAVKGNLASTSAIIRQAAVEAGGLVTVLRNPVKAQYLKQNAAIGGLKQAIDIGNVFLKYKDDTENILEELKKRMSLEIIAKGVVKKYEINIQGGFDVGHVVINSDKRDYDLTFWNEYMTLESNGEILATFPDLIATLDEKTGKVITSADMREKDNIIVIKVDRKNLKLGKGMFDQKLFKQAEDVLNKELIKYIF
ncbi:DUF917 domain-containing protein [Crassaminicella profunda]|uniref:DUF917 domain-containing protein n=1 Tax=Crassaminicella profunda TaxID=1286698 RepID=UPI001CA65DD7|nr:DUF917 family protein [Crassaminicella profunda]QZY56624.1 DUF917 family protein [Crassaminicella profunda]